MFKKLEHPYDNTNNFKAMVFKSSMIEIFLGFILIYILLAVIFSFVYVSAIENEKIIYLDILKFSLLSSFSFSAELKEVNTNIFFSVNLIHQILALVTSTFFTATIVLKFFYLPKFFIFKKKCNYVEGTDMLTISLYNSINLFVTDLRVRIYGRVESVDDNGAKSLININNNKPIYEKTFPFMEKDLATRLKVNFKKEDVLYNWLVEKKVEKKKLSLIIIMEANATNLDRSIYEIHNYKIDSKNISNSIDFYECNSIDLDYSNYSNSKGWDLFDK